jgi:lysophospholipase L1-like esterase
MNILCIGDSITAGTGSTPGGSYPDCLEGYLAIRFKNVTVFSAGMPGYSTKDYREFMAKAIHLPQTPEEKVFLHNQPYEAVIVMLGTNDCRKDNWVESQDSARYLKEIAASSQQLTGGKSSRVFLCSILPLASPMPRDIRGGGHEWRQYRVEEEINPMIRKMARELEMSFIDIYTHFVCGIHAGELLYDGIHPFDSGYRLIAKVVGE